MSWGYLHDLGKPPMVFYVRPQPVTSCGILGHWDDGFKQWGQQLTYTRWFQTVKFQIALPKKWGKLQWMWSICMGWWLDRFRFLRWNYPYFLDLPHLLFSACALTWRLLMCEHGHGWEIGEPNGHLWDSHRTKGGMGRLSSEPWQWLPEEK